MSYESLSQGFRQVSLVILLFQMALTEVTCWYCQSPAQLLLSIRNVSWHGWKAELNRHCPPEHLQHKRLRVVLSLPWWLRLSEFSEKGSGSYRFLKALAWTLASVTSAIIYWSKQPQMLFGFKWRGK